MPINNSVLKLVATVAKQGVLEPLVKKPQLSNPADEPTIVDQFGLKPAYAQALGTPFVDGVSGNDPDQGADGDCYFMAALSAVAQTHPELIQNAIRDNKDGTYTVTLHQPVYGPAVHRLGWLGEKIQSGLNRLAPRLGTKPVEVTVDGKLPNGGNFFARDSQPGELWPALIEKAYAKLWGDSYASIYGGDPAEALQTLVGGEHQSLHTRYNDDDKTFAFVQSALAAKQPLTATSRGLSITGGTGDIVEGHVYSIIGAGEENGQRYVELRNPWGFNNGHDMTPTKRLTLDELRQNFGVLDSVKL